jgi:DNA-directed RNA polymerase specialized sigma24 family protein
LLTCCLVPVRDGQAERGRLRATLQDLSDSDRELLLLAAWENLTNAEAAAALGTSERAARSRLHRARKRALKALQRLRGSAPSSHSVMTTLYGGEKAS